MARVFVVRTVHCVRAYGDVENVKSLGASESLVMVGLGVHVGAVECRVMRYRW